MGYLIGGSASASSRTPEILRGLRRWRVVSPDPIYDSSAKVDISLLSSTPLQILSAIANVAYILGPPSLIVVNPTAYELVGFSGVLETTIIGASGSPVVDAVAPLGAGMGCVSVTSEDEAWHECPGSDVYDGSLG